MLAVEVVVGQSRYMIVLIWAVKIVSVVVYHGSATRSASASLAVETLSDK